MFRSLADAFGSNGEAAPRSARLGVEALEQRWMPTILPPQGGVIKIVGSAGDDTATVRVEGDQVVVRQSGPGYVEERRAALFSVTRIVFNGGNGNDTFRNDTNCPCSAYGENGNDSLWGGGSNDTLLGGWGDDELAGRAGDDGLQGDGGFDRLYGGFFDGLYVGWGGTWGGRPGENDGADFLDGGYDGIRDFMFGGTGADTFVQHYDYHFVPNRSDARGQLETMADVDFNYVTQRFDPPKVSEDNTYLWQHWYFC